LAAIGNLGLKRGLSLNPDTDTSAILPFLSEVDLLLVMSVQPGFGGQSFRPEAIDQISELNDLKRRYNYRYAVSVDGGVDDETATLCREAGADILVAGTFLFKAEDRGRAIRDLRG
jgi:ribulose-phosphate 3-epimerase